ncbi:hypothetical protein NA56DRAFT_660715 [Hyaloscypha hepaticicola]|uniref:Uncharacterized protein n=1 Tax=Hyaloscypha hepaticicola TaxID=2082293 RepID=A0A2J6PYX2_9HELO|nr:hypothetical protein NA56DRAFT_660715 [Hyaloscypha hepaticicola]
MLLLNYITVYGPDKGVGSKGLSNLFLHPDPDIENEDWENKGKGGGQNEGFFRLDLSGVVGRSVNFKQLAELPLRQRYPVRRNWFLSHSLDNDFREASDVLRRLSGRLYGLEYLDLTGNSHWLRALRWTGDVGEEGGIDWGAHWVKLHTLKLYSGVDLREVTEFADVVAFVQAYKEALATEDCLSWWMRKGRVTGERDGTRTTWVEVVKGDLEQYEGLWQGEGVQERKRRALDALKEKWAGNLGWRSPIVFEDERVVEGVVERRSVWEQ